MTYEVPPIFVYGFYLLGMVAVIALLYMFQGWRLKQRVWDKKTKSKKVMVGIFEADGFLHKYLVPKEQDGATVKVKGRSYFWPKDKETSPQEDAIASEIEKKENATVPEDGEKTKQGEARKPPPSLALMQYPEGGFGPKVILRYAEYDEGNPEPRRGFYGMWVKKEGNEYVRCDPGEEGALFIQNQLVVTQSEIDSYKDQIHAIAIGERLKELDVMQQTFRNALANIPNKTLLYILLFLAIVSPFIAGMMGY
jgi:hypothetical protein